MESTIKRSLGQNSTCEDAKGDYCYCRCLGLFHGINHQPIRNREAFLKKNKRPLDECTCVEGYQKLDERVFYHQKTDRYFQVCSTCGGRRNTDHFKVWLKVGNGVKIK